jgi:pyruvate decarboxylase
MVPGCLLTVSNAGPAIPRERKPAYIEIPCNLAKEPCSEPAPFETLMPSVESDPMALATAIDTAAKLISDAQKPVLLAGSKLRAYGAIDAFRELAEALGCAVAVMPDAKGFFSEDHPQFIGVYWGSVSSPGCEPIINGSDIILAAGPMYTDYSTVGWTAEPQRERSINVEPGYARFPSAEYTGITLKDFLSALAKHVRKNDATLVQYQNQHTSTTETATAAADANAPLTRVEMVRQIQNDLDAKTTLLVESGDAWFDGMYMHLPEGARFEIEMLWGAIGWSVAATFGSPPGT